MIDAPMHAARALRLSSMRRMGACREGKPANCATLRCCTIRTSDGAGPISRLTRRSRSSTFQQRHAIVRHCQVTRLRSVTMIARALCEQVLTLSCRDLASEPPGRSVAYADLRARPRFQCR